MDSDWTTKEKREWTMIVFSELLKSFINEKNISVKKLAANVQMDRTLIQKYMSGSRVPKNYREVQKLADGMMLLPEQQGELLDAYYRNLYGDKTYEGYRKIAETLEGMKDFRRRTACRGISRYRDAGGTTGGSGVRAARKTGSGAGVHQPAAEGM